MTPDGVGYAFGATEHELARPFTISRGTSNTTRLVHVRVRSSEQTGWGEAAPSPSVTGEAEADTLAALGRSQARSLDPSDPAKSLERVGRCPPAARAAIDLALHDLTGRLDDEPVHALLGLPAGTHPTTCTVSLGPPDDVVAEARRWVDAGARRLKLKLGDPEHDLERVQRVAEALPDTPLIVDANEGWDRDEAVRLAPQLAQLGVELVEQPVPRDDVEGLGIVAANCDVPVVADEAVCSAADVEALAGADACDGVNVKVQKVGGLLAARDAIDAARDHGLKVLVGCNLETGLGIAAGAALAGAADWLDLDGHLLLAEDPFGAPWDPSSDVGPLKEPGFGLGPSTGFRQLFEEQKNGTTRSHTETK